MDAPIKSLFEHDVARRIEEVIKVDQSDDEVVATELDEYVVTASILRQFVEILEKYHAANTRRTNGMGVWVSGFFGSGKSSFAKILGLAISNRIIAGRPAARRFSDVAGDPRLQVVLQTITEQSPTHAVIFDVSTDRGIRSGNQTLTEIMYGLFLESLGYAKDLDLSELEIGLEELGRLGAFEDLYRATFGKEWADAKSMVVFALSEASRVMHLLDPATYPAADSWVKASKDKTDITAGKLAERCVSLMRRRRPGQRLLFVIDEVGQFVARDVQKMLDLQAIVHNLATKSEGKHWLVVTSQEKLGEMVSGLDDKRIELARLMDRFESQVHLESSDISEVTGRRVLTKNSAAQAVLRKRYEEHQHRLATHTRFEGAKIKLPELALQPFVDLYPLLPYQIELVIQVVSGLRTQGGANKHVGGANRTIIKLAQQLLINPTVALGERPTGTLARLDHVYDLVEGNISSEYRAKIASIRRLVDHPLAPAVAKAICLLQFVQTVAPTAKNIAATLHPDLAAESQLVAVEEALRTLEAAHLVRQGEHGYRIPTPAEDDWEQTRHGIMPRASDSHRLFQEILDGFWQPKPTFTLLDARQFRAGLAVHGRTLVEGDVMFHVHLAEEGAAYTTLLAELKARSQQELSDVFWGVPITAQINQTAIEAHRSREMIERKSRDVKGQGAEPKLVAEERIRLRTHLDTLRALFKAACLRGTVYVRGNDRTPSDRVGEVGKAVATILGESVPAVFHRFGEAAARGADARKGVDALCTATNLHGLPSVFGQLGLLREERGNIVFRTESGPLAEVLKRIDDRASYGDMANGKYLAAELEKEPFGWDFEVVRLLVAALLRANAIEMISKGQTLESATSPEAKATLDNNNHFRAASFRPKRGPDPAEVLEAAEAFRLTFGDDVPELSAHAVVNALRAKLFGLHEQLVAANSMLRFNDLPGSEPLERTLEDVMALQHRPESQVLGLFIACHKALKDGFRRAADLHQALTSARLDELSRAREVIRSRWPFLETEVDLAEPTRQAAATLTDYLRGETFYKQLPRIAQLTQVLEQDYAERAASALAVCRETYEAALRELRAVEAWNSLADHHQRRIAKPLEIGSQVDTDTPIPQVRALTEAAPTRLRAALVEVQRTVDGDRIVTLDVAAFFAGGIENNEQLEAALAGLREAFARLVGAGKKVIVS